MVPGQPSTSGCAARSRVALGVAAASAHGDRLISHSAAVAAVSAVRNLDLFGGSIRSPRVFSKGIFPIYVVAGAGSDSRGLGVRRDNGTVSGPQASGPPRAGDTKPKAKAVRGRYGFLCRSGD